MQIVPYGPHKILPQKDEQQQKKRTTQLEAELETVVAIDTQVIVKEEVASTATENRTKSTSSVMGVAMRTLSKNAKLASYLLRNLKDNAL